MDFIDLLLRRRSVRRYRGARVSEDSVRGVLQAGLMSVSAGHSWEFVLVRDRATLDRMAECRAGSARMLAGADAAILVLGNPAKTDAWTEDCSIAMSNMHLMATSLGLGSCWIQCRMRTAANGQPTEEYLRGILNFPESRKAEAILSLGMPQAVPAPHSLDQIDWSLVHREQY